MTRPKILQAIDGFNVYASGKDANGIFTVTEFKREDGTIHTKSTLSNPDASGNYLTATVDYYDNSGITVIRTEVWTMTYDADGDLVSKVVN